MKNMEIKTTEASDEGSSEEIIEEVLEHTPPKQRKVIEEMMISQIQMRAESSPEAEVMKKLTSEHITDFLDASKEEMVKNYKDRNYQRLFLAVLAFLAMLFVVIIIILLKDTPDVMEKVIYASGGLVTGAIGGYGFGKSKNDN